MRIATQISCFAVAVGIGGCEREGTPTSPEAPRNAAAVVQPAQTETETETETEAEAATPTGLRPLLLARHAGDLPTADELSRRNAASALLELAANDDSLLVRSRALSLLRHFPNADTEALLRSVAADTTLHVKLRAAALRSLGTYDLESRAELRTIVLSALNESNVMVATAAASALTGAPSARASLQRRRGAEDTPAILARAIDDALAQ